VSNAPHWNAGNNQFYASAAGVCLMLKLVIDIKSRDPTGMSETKGSTRTTKTMKKKAPTQADNPATSCKKKKKTGVSD